MRFRLLRAASTFLAIALVATSVAHADVYADSGGDGGIIPDNSPGGRSSVVTITQNQVIQDASFSVEGLDHSWIGDLIITVAHSTSGKSATLLHRVGTTANPNSTGDSSDLNGTYTFNDGNPSVWTTAGNGDTNYELPSGIYDASGVNEALVSLNGIFAGETTQGDWTFTISDVNASETGTFVQTSVGFVTAVPEPGTYAAIFMSTLLGGIYMRRRHMMKKLAAKVV